MKVVAFNGSPRENGNTSILINYALKELEEQGIETELINITERPVRGCMGCRLCATNKDGKCVIKNDLINEYIEKMIDADGIILGSPTYFANVTAEMKALIDRAGCVVRANNHLLKYKVGAAVVAQRRAGATHVFSSINYFFLLSQMIVPGSTYWNNGFGGAEGDVENDKEGIQVAKTLGQNMAWLLKKIK